MKATLSLIIISCICHSQNLFAEEQRLYSDALGWSKGEFSLSYQFANCGQNASNITINHGRINDAGTIKHSYSLLYGTQHYFSNRDYTGPYFGWALGVAQVDQLPLFVLGFATGYEYRWGNWLLVPNAYYGSITITTISGFGLKLGYSL